MRRKLLAVFLSLLVLALVLAGTALAGNGGIAPPGARSPNADRIRDAYWLVLGITGAIFVLVESTLLVFVVRFRSRGRPREMEGPQVRGHERLELIWTVIPVLILAGIASFVFYKLPGIKNTPSASAAGPNLKVRVEGHQFYWQFVYPNGAVAVNELRAPADRVVDLDLTAPRNDVAHSWWIPALGGKMDAIPGKVNHTWFRAPVGLYRGQCAEFCGAQHALMIARVRAVPNAEFESWLAAQAARPATLGKQTFDGACAPCHGDKGQGLIGPPLKGNATLAQAAQLSLLLRNGKGAMPAVGKDWDERQLNALAAYVRGEFASGR